MTQIINKDLPRKSDRFPRLHDPEPEIMRGWDNLTMGEAIVFGLVLIAAAGLVIKLIDVVMVATGWWR